MRRLTLVDIAAFTAAMLAQPPRHSGAMVALYPSGIPDAWLADVGEQLPATAELMPGGELHLSLVYLGERADLPRGAEEAAQRAVTAIAGRWPAVHGELSGLARFTNGEGENDALVALYDSPLLPALRQDLVVELLQAGLRAEQTHGFTPHITLAYLPKDAPAPDLRLAPQPMALEVLKLAWGDKLHRHALQGGPRAALAIGRRNP